ncbi:MAG: FG-GAP repeat protein [Planctomycetes bacterium]|nr:FG-GAP repeat protein [Planctomycetota bacterium]
MRMCICMIGLLLSSTAAAAQTTQLKLRPAPDHSFLLSESCVASAGDVNADGIPDAIVGAYGFVPGSSLVRVFSGRDGAAIHTYLSGTGSGAPNPLFKPGAAAAGLGDVNGDGFDDFILGSPESTLAQGSAGYVTALSGRTGLPLYSVGGYESYDYFGYRCAALGDVNGDGTTDFVAIAITSSSGPPLLRVFSGSDGAFIYGIPEPPEGAAFGRVLAGIGDLDGDGRPDLLVGDPVTSRPFSGNLIGTVFVYSGASGSLLGKVRGEQPDDFFGDSVCGTPDVDGDGVADFVVGAPGQDTPAAGAGCVTWFSGSSLARIRTASIQSSGASFGQSVAALPDLDGDRIPDVAAGAPSLGLHAPNGGFVAWISSASGSVLARHAGSVASGFLGYRLQTIGDTDGDGRAELVTVGRDGSGVGVGLVLSLVPGLREFGAGSPGCEGSSHLRGSRPPLLGETTFQLLSEDAPGSSLGVALLCDAADVAGSDPWSVAVVVHLTLQASTEVIALPIGSDESGRAALTLPIPATPSLLGKTYFAQFFWSWPSSICVPSPLGLSSSTALEIRVGE